MEFLTFQGCKGHNLENINPWNLPLMKEEHQKNSYITEDFEQPYYYEPPSAHTPEKMSLIKLAN